MKKTSWIYFIAECAKNRKDRKEIPGVSEENLSDLFYRRVRKEPQRPQRNPGDVEEGLLEQPSFLVQRTKKGKTD